MTINDLTTTEKFTDADMETLAARLAAIQNEGALSIEGVDGLFCALIASPTLVNPSVYVPVILGGRTGDSQTFVDIEDAQDTLSLLMRYWNAIVSDFRSDEPVHLPPILEPGTDNIPGRDWARGFMRGTRLAPEGWDRIFNDDKEGQVITIPLVAGEVDPAWPIEPLTAEKSDDILNWMLAGAARAYLYFKNDRYDMAERSLAARTVSRGASPSWRPGPKIGRNDPCPCGSGKKFKKCCGGPDGRQVH